MNQWRWIRSGVGDPAVNMAVDEAILIAHSEGKTAPTVRFYGWNPPSLSIGYFQKATHEVDLEEVRRQGIGFVRRATGGRAVLHDKELTYSMIVAEDYPGLPKRVTEAYRVLSQGLLNGFLNLGLDAEMVTLASEEEKAKYESIGSAACFDSPSWYELVVEGRKVAGSAQVRQREVVLQHGSILLDMDAKQLFSLLKFRNDSVKERLERSFSSKAVAINQLRQERGLTPVKLEEVEQAFARGIAEGMNIHLEEDELSPYELELAEQLVRDKYGSDDWNFRR
ncbi:biotin/lipoate A/B protein ligase family protein [Paenibacillus sp. J2TS4]|uniref:lipoate--protein ligase family protein n=1 Tax=Paenibacillus sp. J2TS4 TaxID=2807194 RepID=UPI001B0913D4|nr:biotin/lipoate A/B protein ligase family protein [Paenibacillus sp. J2TS4]GIP33985.1 octanoyltransferase LipM [Paenibacillus sp. J2TS4]